MNAFANPAHERAAAELVRGELPDAFLSVSSRGAADGPLLQPRLDDGARTPTSARCSRDYLAQPDRAARRGRASAACCSSCSRTAASRCPRSTARRPATHALLSGPAGGPARGRRVRRAARRRRLHRRRHGRHELRRLAGARRRRRRWQAEGEIDRLRIALPMLDIATIGAGGGSIGWIDEGGLLRMGPQSAGAIPGPACYGRGGERPTCTDANLVLGYLDPALLRRRRAARSTPTRARAAIETHVAEPLGPRRRGGGGGHVPRDQRQHGARRARDHRQARPRPARVPDGRGRRRGRAARLHDRAASSRSPSLLVPPTASVLCAAGMLLSDLQHDFVRSYIAPLRRPRPGAARARSSTRWSREGDAQLRRARACPPSACDHEVAPRPALREAVPRGHACRCRASAIERGDLAAIAARLPRASTTGSTATTSRPRAPTLELINVRVRSVGRDREAGAADARARAAPSRERARKGAAARLRARARRASRRCPVYDGHALRAGNAIPGPALIERTDTTIFVSAALRRRGSTSYGTLSS